MSSLITNNRKAKHDYHIEQTFEAGISLAGWEVKSLRAGKAQLSESHIIIKNGEAFLLNSNISPLKTISTHITPNPTRTRKLLLNKKELDKLIGASERKGYTIVPLNLHWKKNIAKVDIALAKGKRQYDKRETEKQKTWEREKQKLMKNSKRFL